MEKRLIEKKQKIIFLNTNINKFLFQDLTTSTKEFSKSAAILANSEEQLNLSRALSQLGEVYEKIEQIYLEQSNADYFVMSELVKDYVCLFDNIKEIFYKRIKLYGNLQRAEETLKSKKDTKAKLDIANKQDKIPAALAEIKDVNYLFYLKYLNF